MCSELGEERTVTLYPPSNIVMFNLCKLKLNYECAFKIECLNFERGLSLQNYMGRAGIHILPQIQFGDQIWNLADLIMLSFGGNVNVN